MIVKRTIVIRGHDHSFLSFSVMVQGDSSKESSKDLGKELMSQSLRLAEYTFFLQVLLRVITFATNGLAYRCVDASVLGLVNFRLGLYYSTLVFTSRESFRRACLSRGGEILLTSGSLHSDARLKWQALLNVMWLTVPVGVLLSFILLPLWLYIWPSPSVDSSSSATEHQYTIACLFYTLSALLELATEPMWLVCQLEMCLRARIVLEAIANIARALGIIVALYLGDGASYGLYLLAFPQLLHGSTLLLGYLFFASWLVNLVSSQRIQLFGRISPTGLRDLLPNFNKVTFDWPCLWLSWNFFRQGVLKQFLTEGERYLISAFHLLSFADQGIYDLVNNLGSLAPRLVFSSIEESCHLLFSQCIQRDVAPKRQNEALVLQAVRMLETSLRVLTLVAWLGFIFSQAYSHLLLYLYGGSRLVSTNPEVVTLLRIFALYLVFLAWNGPTEAFLNAAMTTTGVSRHNFRLTAFSLVFLGAAWILVPLCGAAGFILANCVNIFSRVVYSCHFINHFVHRVEENCDLTAESVKQLRAFSLFRLMFPSGLQMALSLLALVMTLVSEYVLCSSLTLPHIVMHIAVGAITFSGLFFVILWEEKSVFTTLAGTGFGRIFGRLYHFLPF
ncbi:Protein RFT1 -like protein [Echinococcus granulosus]|nr:Protein RFT1 -like protein [Echinococcus granulosus]